MPADCRHGEGCCSGVSGHILDMEQPAGGGIQETVCRAPLSPSLPARFLAHWARKGIQQSVPPALLMSRQKERTQPAPAACSSTCPPPGDRARPGLGHQEARGSLTWYLVEKLAAPRQLCAFGGFRGNASNSWHKHSPPPGTGAHTSESTELLWNVITSSVNFCVQNAVFYR